MQNNFFFYFYVRFGDKVWSKRIFFLDGTNHEYLFAGFIIHHVHSLEKKLIQDTGVIILYTRSDLRIQNTFQWGTNQKR